LENASSTLLYKAAWNDHYIQTSSYIYTNMALSIKDPEADRLAREVAKATGETLTMAVIQALRERLARVRRPRGPRLSEELLKIGRRCARLPVQDPRSADELVGYDEHGLPR
jgi:antitoxin VapB